MKITIVVGNGTSIALANEIGIGDDVDLGNLFAKGSEVPWPYDSKPGFLSHKNTPALWQLGARPFSKREQSNQIIENIITCSNVFASMPSKKNTQKVNSVYIQAYNELSKYLRHLFAYYDEKFVEKLNSQPLLWDKWHILQFINRMNSNANIKEISVISYNYDILLERGLIYKSIPFELFGIDDRSQKSKSQKVTIYKPHGSISYIPKGKIMDKARFQISPDWNPNGLAMHDYVASYSNLNHPVLNEAIIPPAGESSRYNYAWANEIQKGIRDSFAKPSKDDVLIFCGLSYWSVDRLELDEIIKLFHSEGQVYSINPDPNHSFIAVLTTVFKNFVHFNNAKQLEGAL